jgi:hypothetical protein
MATLDMGITPYCGEIGIRRHLQSPVQLRLKIGDGTDQRGPQVRLRGLQGWIVIHRERRRSRGLPSQWAGLLGWPREDRERVFFFSLSVSFISKSFQILFKTQFESFCFLVKTTHYKNTNAPACMHNNVAKPYDKF